PENGDSITANNLWTPKVKNGSFPFNSDRAITIDLDQTADFYRTGYYSGISLERKKSGQADSSFVEIGQYSKNYISDLKSKSQSAVCWDEAGLPDTSYIYRIRTLVGTNSVRYAGSDTVVIRNCPQTVGPDNIARTDDYGRVGLAWSANSKFSDSQSKGYSN